MEFQEILFEVVHNSGYTLESPQELGIVHLGELPGNGNF